MKKWEKVRQEHLIIFKKLGQSEQLDIIRDGLGVLTTDQLIDVKLHLSGLLMAKAKAFREFDGIMSASYGKEE